VILGARTPPLVQVGYPEPMCLQVFPALHDGDNVLRTSAHGDEFLQRPI